MTKKIDWTKPIAAHDGRPAFVMGDNVRLEKDGERVVAIALGQYAGAKCDTSTPLYRSYDTNEPRPHDRSHGRAVHFVNIVHKSEVFLRYNVESGDTSSHRHDPQGHAVVSVKLTLTDGIVTGASLHRTNVYQAPQVPHFKSR